MAEDEAPRHRRRAQQLVGQQRVERGEGVGLRQLGDRARHVGLERLAGDRRRLEQRALGRRQVRQLLGQRGRHRRRDAGRRRALVEHGLELALLLGPDELLQVEGVAAAVAEDRRRRPCVEVAHQLAGVGLVEPAEREPARRADGQCGAQASGRLARAEGEGEQHRKIGPAAQEGRDQLERGAVAPVQVVQHEDERAIARQHLQQGAHRPMHPEALVG
jgi:hypothetical protein